MGPHGVAPSDDVLMHRVAVPPTANVGGRHSGRAAAAAGKLSLCLLLAVITVSLAPAPAVAHPLGNFTTNVYAGIVVRPDAVAVDYVLDLAEVPALRVVQRLDADADGTVSSAEGAPYERQQCDRLAGGLVLDVDGNRASLDGEPGSLSFPPGQAGLVTLRLECTISGPISAGRGQRVIAVKDTNLADRIGWREMVANGDGMTLVDSTVPDNSVSDRLRSYPQDRIASPLDVTSAALTVRPGAAATGLPATVVPGPVGRSFDRFTTAFTDLVAAQDLTLGLGLIGLLLAIGLGGLHAVAPGHGKTVMAAVIVSREGTPRQALGLGMTVAVTHTLGVLLLGVVFTFTAVLSPERLYAWLGVASGLLFATVGLTLLRGALLRRRSRTIHEPHVHATDLAIAGPRWRMVVPGLAGGLVPSPSALLVLLGGIALGRAWFGVALVAAYGIGMACVLVGAGWLLNRARGRLSRRASSGRLARVLDSLPVVTAGLVVGAGLFIAARAAFGVL